MLLDLVFLAMLFASSQPPVPSASPVPQPAPPPPPVKEAPAPQAPQRIRVGSQVQAAELMGLGDMWVSSRATLTHEQFESDQSTVSSNPEDVCARGRLIAYQLTDPLDRERQASSLARVEHLAWMIQYHPEWDGFSLQPSRTLAEPRSPQERDIDIIKRLKAHWLKQVGPEQKIAMVLHNAAMFFAIREPELAASLLKRAIALDPLEPLYVERLGLVYWYAQQPVESFARYGVVNSPERAAFAQQARALSGSTGQVSGHLWSVERADRFCNRSCRVR